MRKFTDLFIGLCCDEFRARSKRFDQENDQEEKTIELFLANTATASMEMMENLRDHNSYRRDADGNIYLTEVSDNLHTAISFYLQSTLCFRESYTDRYDLQALRNVSFQLHGKIFMNPDFAMWHSGPRPSQSLRLQQIERKRPFLIFEIEIGHRTLRDLYTLVSDVYLMKPVIQAVVGILVFKCRLIPNQMRFAALAVVFERNSQGKTIVHRAISFGNAPIHPRVRETLESIPGGTSAYSEWNLDCEIPMIDVSDSAAMEEFYQQIRILKTQPPADAVPLVIPSRLLYDLPPIELSLWEIFVTTIEGKVSVIHMDRQLEEIGQQGRLVPSYRDN